MEQEKSANKYQYFDEGNTHLHTLYGKPLLGTSTVGDVLKKDGLTWWASGLAVKEFGCTDGKVLTKLKNGKATPEEKEAMEKSVAQVFYELKNMSLDEYLSKLTKAYNAHNVKLKDSAVAGTDMHFELEKYVKKCIRRNNGIPLDNELYKTSEHKAVEIFAIWAVANVKRFLWSEMHCYSEVLWTGGICDVGYEKFDGTYGLMDFKSAKEAYANQFFQCAGYVIEIEENGGFDRDGNKTFDLGDRKITELAVFPFGMDKPEPQFYKKSVDIAKESFIAETVLYKNIYL